MADNIENRAAVIRALREELVGPAPIGKELDCSADLRFSTMEEARGPFKQKQSGEEILMRDRPRQRYGVGVLHPVGTPVLAEEEEQGSGAAVSPPQAEIPEVAMSELGVSGTELVIQGQAQAEIDAIRIRAERGRGLDDESDDFDLASANAMRPGSMGISFLVDIPPDAQLVVDVSGGRYYEKRVEVIEGNYAFSWWLRRQVTICASFDSNLLFTESSTLVAPSSHETVNTEGLDLRVQVFTRPHRDNQQQRLLTVALVNRTNAGPSYDTICLFQARFVVRLVTPNSAKSETGAAQVLAAILPYPEPYTESPDPEERALALLYRSHSTYAVGHGCAGDWPEESVNERKHLVRAECLPSTEVPTITSDILKPISDPEAPPTLLQVPMAVLAGLVPDNDGFADLQQVISLYSDWIRIKRNEIPLLPEPLRVTGLEHLEKCLSCANRMQAGLDYLFEPAQKNRALRAFRLANYAIMLQQIAGQSDKRLAHYDSDEQRVKFTPAYAGPETRTASERVSRVWRAFQIAFILMALPSVAKTGDPERELVELIWFPTGGGKTEAYLGLAAFVMFLRRIDHNDDIGVNVLMRYTLRLLTAQQFQRAAGLLCAMEFLRKQVISADADLGDEPFSIGIWVGGDTTPNSDAKALQALTAIETNPKAENPFLITRCPWCGASMGPFQDNGNSVPTKSIKRKNSRSASVVPRVIGYHRIADTVAFQCPDLNCPFSKKLPVFVIDEAIYRAKPTLVIGTVDKFAQLTWRPVARSLFGLASDGVRQFSPPTLIIQDELHLISGPLGSMVGLYETLIEELCTDRRVHPPILPKIVCSTATIRRFHDQIKALYARDQTALFPPPGLDAGDSFFAVYARNHFLPTAPLLPGKIYIGVHGPGHGSLLTTQVRVNSVLLQAAANMPPTEADPWWTLLIFFNSMRELGGALTLLDADIPERLKQLCVRNGHDYSRIRQLWTVMELTSRLRNDEVPRAIDELKTPYSAKPGRPVDVCLASNIIEVGVDIDRLSLMSVVGQPKTTSQYIQVTGRVGRRPCERPGLVITLYSASKPRDRSHYEKFRTYHERLYAQVEPTSVTPFSPPLIDRALHAVLVAFVRQTGAAADTARPDMCPSDVIHSFRDILLPRLRSIDPTEERNVTEVLDRREAEWERWHRTSWQSGALSSGDALLRPAGEYIPADVRDLSWATPTSLRNVDAECQAQITSLYLNYDNSPVVEESSKSSDRSINPSDPPDASETTVTGDN